MNAPRVTEDEVDSAIRDVAYVVLPDQRTTVCQLTLDNGYTVRGESSCLCAENFNAGVGQELAYKDARGKVWALLAFRLADRLATEGRGPRYRSARSGEYVSEQYAMAFPEQTVRET